MASGDRKPRVLFLCTGNSCRSQMAEGWAKALKSDVVEAFSAGTTPNGMNPLAIRAMAEVGVDISDHSSKRPQDLGIDVDYVVTVCDAASESCPHFPAGTRVIHIGCDDPPGWRRALRATKRPCRINDAFAMRFKHSFSLSPSHLPPNSREAPSI